MVVEEGLDVMGGIGMIGGVGVFVIGWCLKIDGMVGGVDDWGYFGFWDNSVVL